MLRCSYVRQIKTRMITATVKGSRSTFIGCRDAIRKIIMKKSQRNGSNIFSQIGSGTTVIMYFLPSYPWGRPDVSIPLYGIVIIRCKILWSGHFSVLPLKADTARFSKTGTPRSKASFSNAGINLRTARPLMTKLPRMTGRRGFGTWQ